MRKRKRKKRIQNGLIIRLIDVVFILLFGFISISEVDRRSQIKLAVSQAVEKNLPDREAVVFVGVLPEGKYLVENETNALDSLNALIAYFQEKRMQLEEKNIKMRVRIRASRDAAVKYTFPIVNVCNEMQLPVGMDVLKGGKR
jgi:biopolymer transport protein ExbD